MLELRPSRTAAENKTADRRRKKVRFFMNKISKKLLQIITDFTDEFRGAFNIRENGECAGRRSTPNIRIETKKVLPVS